MINEIKHIEHFKSVIKILFPDLADKAEIRIYNPEKDIFPSYVNSLLIPGGNLIEVNLGVPITNLEEIQKKLNKFLNKFIRNENNSKVSILYWFEDEFIYDVDEDFGKHDNLIQFNRLKSETRLPGWLEKYVFDSLHAEYSPDHQRFGFNLENDNDEQLIYLGTYFPRSYSESFCITEGILENAYYGSLIETKTHINILDIGCGTGGSTIGLVIALSKKLPEHITFNIYAIDGNDVALKIFEKIINKYSSQTTREINTKTYNVKFDKIGDLAPHMKSLTESRFDFIISFKTICEVILKGGTDTRSSYYDFIKLFSSFLTPEGLVLILDVTSRIVEINYLPILLNSQVSRFIKESPMYRMFSPKSCYFHGDQCECQCFYQHTFLITHKFKTNDQSRVAYKIVGNKKFVDDLSKDFKKSKFIVNWKHFENEDSSRCYCPYSVSEVEISDSYKID